MMLVTALLAGMASFAGDTMSLSKLAPVPHVEEEKEESQSTFEQNMKAERVEIDHVPFIKFSSKAGAIYLPNLKRDELSPKRLEESYCSDSLDRPQGMEQLVMRADANVTEEFKPYAGVIINTIRSKCANNSDRVQSGRRPVLETGVQYRPTPKKPGDELESYKAFARPLNKSVGVGTNF
jgi:hypothetical protein